MSFLKRTKECNNYKKKNFYKFYILNKHIGYIKKKNLDIIKNYKEYFFFDNEKISLDKKINSFSKRTFLFNKIFNLLVKKKKILSKHREFFPVFSSFKSKPLLKVQRLLGPFFGFQFFGVHLNGFIIKDKKYMMWVGKRSKKGNFPNDLDQIAAGGLPYNINVKNNLIKEALEEANINKSLTKKSKYIGTVSYRVETKLGLSRHILFCYDLQLPETFFPQNNDGEIQKFYLWNIDKILKIIKNTKKFKFDCALVILLFSIKKKLIKGKNLFNNLNNNSDLKILN